MNRSRGFTLLEILVTLTLLTILASMVMPLAKRQIIRHKELDLRRDLREIRCAIDSYKDSVESKKIKTTSSSESNGYPPCLEILVEGQVRIDTGVKLRFLRKIPVDPFTQKSLWGLRSISDSPNSLTWGGSNVYDVYSLATGIGSNGIPYRDW